MSDPFDDFWQMYPRKVAKRAARKVWDTEMRRGTEPLEIITGLQRNLPGLLAKETQYIPHPRTWLFQGRWEDEPEQPVSNSFMNVSLGDARH